jgi:hypothetical protein
MSPRSRVRAASALFVLFLVVLGSAAISYGAPGVATTTTTVTRTAVSTTTTTLTKVSTSVTTGTTTSTITQRYATTTLTATVKTTQLLQRPSAPFGLQVRSAVKTLPATGGTFPDILVSLVDATGNPSEATSPIQVTLNSSAPAVGTVTPAITIPAGGVTAVANFTTTTVPGITSLTVNATGLVGTVGHVVTAGLSGIPVQVALFAMPNQTLIGGGATGVLLVELEDSNGNPALSYGTTTVTLNPSPAGLVRLSTQTVAIPTGESVSAVKFTSGSSVGTCVIYGSSSGLVPATFTISVVPATLRLKLTAEPPSLPVGASGSLLVSLLNYGGNAVLAPYSLTVYLSSTNNTVLSVPSTVKIGGGAQFAQVPVTGGSKAGGVNVTASGQGLATAQIPIQISTPVVAGSLALTLGPNPLVSSSGPSGAFTVSLVNGTGFPGVAASPITVVLSSSNPLVGTVPPQVTIATGQSYAAATFNSTSIGGGTTITASASNLATAQVTARTNGYGTDTLALVPDSEVLPADGQTVPALAVDLLDSTGLPAAAPANVLVSLSSTNPNYGAVPATVTIPAGQNYAIVNITTTLLPGPFHVTASAFALPTVIVKMSTGSVSAPALSLNLNPGTTIIGPLGKEALVSVDLENSAGSPVRAQSAIPVNVTASGIPLKVPLVLTIPAGGEDAFGLISPVTNGTLILTGTAPGFASVSATSNVLGLPVQVGISLSSGSPYVGGTTNATLSVLYLSAPLQGANVTVKASGTVTPSAGATDVKGQFNFALVPAATGAGSITVTVVDPLIGTESYTKTILVAATPPQPSFISSHLTLVVGAVVVAVVVLLGVLILARRRGWLDRLARRG